MKKLILAGALLLTAACSNQEAAKNQNSDLSNDVSGIVGGELVTALDPIAHSTVQLYALTVGRDMTGSYSYRVSSCTGTLISDKVILTAAHCTKRNPKQLFVYFSHSKPANLWSEFQNLGKNPLFRQISGGLAGDKWPQLTGREEKDWDDIALLRFEDGIPQGYTKAELVPAQAAIQTNDFVTLAGFGITDGVRGTETEGLRKVDVVLTDAQYSPSEILVGDEKGKGACHGDSGGPAFLQAGAKKYVIGVTSRADVDKDPNGICKAGAVYTSVQAHLAWIQKGVAALEAPDFEIAPIAQPRIQ